MALTNKIVAKDEVKEMSYELELAHLTIQINAQVKKTIKRDPGTKQEIELGTDNTSMPISINGMIETPAQLKTLVEENPFLAKILPLILEEYASKYSFSKK